MLGRVHARCFRASAPRAGGAHNPEWLAPDHNTWATHINHRMFMPIVYMYMCPVALVLSPSMLAMPLDLAMGVLIPVHAHCNANMIISDYAHWITKAKWFDTALRMALVPVTGTLTRLTFLGLLNLNLRGPGLTESVKALWRKPAEP
ncbi:Hypothetical protein EMIHUDRAFT_237621 [Emiliania huxleyi CCMP1516]|uniref:Succinate dehydrogenase [ubiquinone] cytochrome b small subunit n=2 Tax=Emiliania huxleyi TaxID=2903 RepID=A0A0D3JPS0_EMIH1|nr:Hypothetical protein EMIHUDRAFT_237621 [Emiliania huxleyi CCMP1516]EOD25505.1 Hypothetical protein EMIHUDRAFT_237621 [Emiliania huxleyi CCMP1516]|eukprot:XP_005777934.1 Hypothetical protein EMIHUDRAFT_237621 [Emiliania huxleyi CCMP1516]